MSGHPYSCFADHAPAHSPQWMLEILEYLQVPPTRSVPMGVHYIYDLIEQQTLYTTGSIAALLGYSAAQIHTMGPIGLAHLIHPADLNRVSEHYQRFYTLRYGEVISIKYRMKRANGTWCWLHSQETVLLPDEIGTSPCQILGILRDISRLSVRVSVRSRGIRRFKRRRRSGTPHSCAT